MIPGELITEPGELELNAGLPKVTIAVANTGDRPIQVGSHYHFYETNAALDFDRDKARGFRLDIAAGTAVRFEPGQTREVTLVEYAGEKSRIWLPWHGDGETLRWRRLIDEPMAKCLAPPWGIACVWQTPNCLLR